MGTTQIGAIAIGQCGRQDDQGKADQLSQQGKINIIRDRCRKKSHQERQDNGHQHRRKRQRYHSQGQKHCLKLMTMSRPVAKMMDGVQPADHGRHACARGPQGEERRHQCRPAQRTAADGQQSLDLRVQQFICIARQKIVQKRHLIPDHLRIEGKPSNGDHRSGGGKNCKKGEKGDPGSDQIKLCLFGPLVESQKRCPCARRDKGLKDHLDYPVVIGFEQKKMGGQWHAQSLVVSVKKTEITAAR